MKFCHPGLKAISLCDRPGFGIMGCKYLRLFVALVLVGSVKPSCLTEHQIDYLTGHNLNVGYDDKQPDLENCRSYCGSNHPTATYFTYVKPHGISNNFGRQCWCKTTNSGRIYSLNKISGEVCKGKWCASFSTLKNHYQNNIHFNHHITFHR